MCSVLEDALLQCDINCTFSDNWSYNFMVMFGKIFTSFSNF